MQGPKNRPRKERTEDHWEWQHRIVNCGAAHMVAHCGRTPCKEKRQARFKQRRNPCLEFKVKERGLEKGHRRVGEWSCARCDRLTKIGCEWFQFHPSRARRLSITRRSPPPPPLLGRFVGEGRALHGSLCQYLHIGWSGGPLRRDAAPWGARRQSRWWILRGNPRHRRLVAGNRPHGAHWLSRIPQRQDSVMLASVPQEDSRHARRADLVPPFVVLGA